MKINTLLKKWWVWLFLGITLLLTITIILTSTYINPWLQNKLETTVREQTEGLYTLKLHGLDASLLRGRLTTDSLSLTPDFDVWDKKHEQDTVASPRTLMDMQIGRLVLGGLNYIGILRGKPLDLTTLRVYNPTIVLTEMRQDTTTENKPLHASLEGIAKSIRIRNMLFEGGNLRTRKSREAKKDQIALENFTIRVNDFRLDSTSFNDKNRAYYAKGIVIDSGKVNLFSAEGKYRFKIGALKMSTADSTLTIGNFEMIPLMKNAEMAGKEGMAVTTINVKIPEINFSGVNYSLHTRHNNIAVRSVIFKSPSLSAYLDRKNFLQKGDKPLPHDFIQNLKTGLTIQNVKVEGMYIRYEELAPEGYEAGLLEFKNVYASFSNITNDKNLMSAEKPAVVKAKGDFNGHVLLDFTVRLSLLDKNGFHTIQGTIGAGNPASLNSILEPTTFMSIKEGKIQGGSYTINLYRNRATGNLKIRYNDFKVDILTKDEDKRQSFLKKILSRAANKTVLKSDNPGKDGELRDGEIKVERAKRKSVINYWKDCLVSGFLSTAGAAGIGADLEDPNR